MASKNKPKDLGLPEWALDLPLEERAEILAIDGEDRSLDEDELVVEPASRRKPRSK